MTYTKQEWIDQQTVISAARMDHIEGGIEAAHVEADDLDARLTAAEGQADDLDTRLTAAEGEADALDVRLTAAEGEADALDVRLTAAEGALDALGTGAWADLPLTSPWTPYEPTGTSYYPGVRARRVSAGVQVQGMVKGGAANTGICTLPTGMFPAFGGHFPAISDGVLACVFVSNTGQVRYLSGGSSSAYVSINLVLPLP